MASRTSSVLAFFLAINLVFFSYTSAAPCAPKPPPTPKPTPKPCKPGTGGSTGGSGSNGGGINIGVGGPGGIIGGGNGGGIIGGGPGGIIGGGKGGGISVGGGNGVGGGIVSGGINVGVNVGGGVLGGGSSGGVSTGGGRGGYGKCPIDTLKLGVCANVLNGLLNAVVGKPPKMPCCTLIQGLVDLEAAVCLCTAIRANILGINLNVPVSLSLLVNYCGKKVPKGFICP